MKGEGDRLERRFQRIDEITEVVDDNNTESVQKLQVLLDKSCLIRGQASMPLRS